jgi:hypothetical protein
MNTKIVYSEGKRQDLSRGVKKQKIQNKCTPKTSSIIH